MLKFGVSFRKEEELLSRLERLGIRESDIEESFIRSPGRGGQHVNKVSTCVYLKHLPTTIEVKASLGRSQSLNRFFARRLLADKIEMKITGKISEEKARIEKIRRQKRKRSKRAKEKMLENKKKHSEKKRQRKPVSPESRGHQ